MSDTITIEITAEEIALLRSALDSYEYWEHRDELPHDSGFITVLDDDDFKAKVLDQYTDWVELQEAKEAWEAVKTARALESKLAALGK